MHADEHVEANTYLQSGGVMFVRLVGFLLLELFDRRATLSEGPTASLVEKIESSSREGSTVHDVVFEVGKWYWDHLLRTCAFDFLLHRSVLPTGRSPWGPQHPPYSFRVLLSRGNGKGLHDGRW